MQRWRACCTDAICSWTAGSLCGMSFICTRGGLLGYRRGSCCTRGPQGTARDGMRVRTGMAGASLLSTLVWIVFT